MVDRTGSDEERLEAFLDEFLPKSPTFAAPLEPGSRPSSPTSRLTAAGFAAFVGKFLSGANPILYGMIETPPPFRAAARHGRTRTTEIP
jgi:hypothetical protein